MTLNNRTPHIDLQLTPPLVNNIDLTKNNNTQCHALNMAFFVSKIQRACYLLKGNSLGLRHENKVRISKYGRVKAQNTRLIYLGNMCSRVIAISNTRSPVKGGPTTKNNNGGHPMPLNTSKRAIIRTIQTVHTANGIKATIHTRFNQKAVIGRLFTSPEQLSQFIESQGLNSSLIGGGGL